MSPDAEPPRSRWRLVLWLALYAVAAGAFLRWLDAHVTWNW